LVVSKSTIRDNAWTDIYTYLQTTNAISTNNIFSAWNSTLAEDKGYPLVIIGPPKTSFSKIDLQASSTNSEVVMTIEVYHNNSANLKALADEVTDKLEAGRSTFATAGIFNMDIDSGSFDTWREGNKKIHHYAFDVSFNFMG